MPSVETWWLTTDNMVHVQGIHDAVDGSWVNDATVTATMANAAGTAVTGVGTVTLGYVTGSNGDYVGVVPDTASLTEDEVLTLTITMTATIDSVSYKRTSRIKRRVAYDQP